MRARRNTNPYPDVVSDRVWNLLHVWAEWRSVRSCPRCLPAPEQTGRWVMQDRRLVYDAVIAMQPRSTKVPDPGAMEVFNQCMMDLDEDLRAYLAVAVKRQCEPWLRGKAGDDGFGTWE